MHSGIAAEGRETTVRAMVILVAFDVPVFCGAVDGRVQKDRVERKNRRAA
jgi:hypothetical protein